MWTNIVGASILFLDKTSFFGTTTVRWSHGFQPIQVYMDTEACLISYKTQHLITQSMHLAAAHCRARNTLRVAPESEVLLVNQYGEIMDGTSFTPYFFRKGHWVTRSESSGGTRRATRRFALTQCFCEEADILTSELAEGESCRPSCDGRGLFYGMTCFPGATSNLPSEHIEVGVINLVNEDVERDDSCESQHLSKGEVEEEEEAEGAELARCSSSSLPRLPSLAVDSSPSPESAEESPSASLSDSDASMGSIQAEADYEPDKEVRPKKCPVHGKKKMKPAIARMSRLRPSTDEAGPRYPERCSRPKRRGQEGRRCPRRACADRATDYGSRETGMKSSDHVTRPANS